MKQVGAVILAAGKGTRMKSELPKVLHKVCGKFLVEWVIEAVKQAGIPEPVVVIGYQGERVVSSLPPGCRFAEQREQLGTGHAVMQSERVIPNDVKEVVVLCGDTPLITTETVSALINYHRSQGAGATVLTAYLEQPFGYGRVVRGEDGGIEKIVEEKDATPEEKAVREINSGSYCFDRDLLYQALKQISPANAQGEYYLTDVIGILRKAGHKVAGMAVGDPFEVLGINDRCQLAEAEQILRRRVNHRLMADGVTMIDPATTFIDDGVEIGRDTIIYPFTMIEGKTVIGSNSRIGPMTRVVSSEIGCAVEIVNSIVLESKVGDNCQIGPFAYIRPETVLEEKVKVGDFVELKKSLVGEGSKIPHLSYVGDTTVGKHVNIGAGTITCNYDGREKHRTVIGHGAFIGSNTNLVAPVKIGRGALIAAGSTITKDVPDMALGVARSKQTNISDWVKKTPVE